MDTTKNYETMSTQDLRTEARTRPALVGAWIASATKGVLIEALKANDAGNPFVRPVRGPQQQLVSINPAPSADTPEARILAAIKDMIPAQGIDPEALASINEAIESIGRRVDVHTETLGTLASQVTDLAARTPRPLAITINNAPTVTFDTAHAKLATLIRALSVRKSNGRRINVLMVGPSGTGKTHAAEQAAEALKLPYYAISVGPQTTMSHLMGYKDAQGVYQRTLFREAVENGGVFLFDEFDSGDPCVATCINAATSNSMVPFPDGMVKVHADFVCIAAGNTYGRGADRQYVGRNQLDAATLARFAVIDWDYDTALEDAITSNVAWRERVRSIRKKADEQHIRIVVSTRAIMDGEALLAAGEAQADVEEMVIFKGIDSSTRAKIA